jgi:hypothetical protein
MMQILAAVFNEEGWFEYYYIQARHNIEVELMKEAARKVKTKEEYSQEDFNNELLRRFEQLTKNKPKRLKVVEHNQQQDVSSAILDNSIARINPSQHAKEAIKITTEKPSIDYDITYKKIATNLHLIQVMGGQLSIERDVLKYRLCRMNFFFHLIRSCFIQMIIVSTQYNNVLAVSLLLLLEVGKASLSTVLYVKRRHYRHFLLFLLDVSQNLFLSVFLVVCMLYIHGDSSDTRSKDMLCVWLIILLCVVEYVVTFLYVISRLVVVLKTWIQTRAASKYRSKKSIFEFISLYDGINFIDSRKFMIDEMIESNQQLLERSKEQAKEQSTIQPTNQVLPTRSKLGDKRKQGMIIVDGKQKQEPRRMNGMMKKKKLIIDSVFQPILKNR